MTPPVITSRHNPLVRDLRAALRAPGRRAPQCALEGWRLLEAALDAGVPVDVVVLTPDAAGSPRAAALRGRLGSRHRPRLHPGVREVVVTDAVFGALTQVDTPQGVLALAARPPDAGAAIAGDPHALLVVLDGVQDPGNTGAIVRSAVAAGATGVLTVGQAADPFGPKALRASAGAAFRLPIAHAATPGAAAELCARAGLRCVVADPRGEIPLARARWDRPFALVFGSEGAGADPAWRAAGAVGVRVPVPGPVESLNVAAAAAVLLYHAAGLLAPEAEGRRPET